jgi:hypothetical protein
LAGFWESSYALVGADMWESYKKHYWPEDPLNAEATTKSDKFEDSDAKQEQEDAVDNLQQQSKRQKQKSEKKKK